MELRRLSLYLALFMLAVYTRCSGAHVMQKRENSIEDYDFMGDEGNDDETQNDDGGNETEAMTPVGKILTQSADWEIQIGSKVQLACKVDPPVGPVIQWWKNDKMMFMGKIPVNNEGNRFSIVEGTSDLLIDDLKPSDSGVFICKIAQTNPVEVRHVLTVLEAPRITVFTATNRGVVMEGDKLELTCNASGSPIPEILFSRDGDVGNGLVNKEGEVSKNVLVIDHIKPEQAGKYYCYAFNKPGHNQASLHVTVLHKPKVHVHKAVINSDIGVEALLQCIVHGNPAPSITWYKDNVLISTSSPKFTISTNGPHSNLTVMPTDDQDFGTFTCKAINTHGEHQKQIELVQRPVIDELSVDGNKLAFKVHSHQPLEEIQLMLFDTEGKEIPELSIPVPTEHHHVYEVTHTIEQASGKYEAVVSARNTKFTSKTPARVIEIDVQPMSIQTASVFGRGGAHSIRPGQAVLVSTIVMYLLVRMF